MPPLYDLHCHSTASDGDLAPTAVVQRAAERGVTDLALTDHDSVAGIAEADAAAKALAMRLIPGIELSTTWQRHCIHVVGLNLDPTATDLLKGIEQLGMVRDERAREIGRRLGKLGFSAAYDTAVALTGAGMITRTHFARALVQLGHATDEKAAFERFLAQGKPAYVGTEWVELGVAIQWIRQAGGVAVLAHPLRYKLTATKLRALLQAFVDAGGEAVEVVCGNSNHNGIVQIADLAKRHGLMASAGSDFHSPEQYWIELGRLHELPADLTPVWRRWL